MVMPSTHVRKIQERIINLKDEKNAVILAHNYQRPEIQDIADFVGDSLDLARKAKGIEAKIIVFCGVKFMAEMAHILNPEKKTLLPNPKALCPMAAMVDVEVLEAMKRDHPDALVVSYVNTTASVKSVSDICVTSANAAKIIRNLDAKEIIFVPDTNLGLYVQSQVPEKRIHVYPGYCYTHKSLIKKEDILKLKDMHPDAKILVHPECNPEVIALADSVESTNGMVRYARNSNAKEFIIATERELTYRLKREMPDKEFYFVEGSICNAMKSITIHDVLNSIENEVYEITLPEEIRIRALAPVEKMLAMS